MRLLLLIVLSLTANVLVAQESILLPIQEENIETYYDTIIIYDTVIVEEIIYDTVIVYDTIFVEEVLEYIQWREQNDVKWYAEAYLKPEFAFPNHTGTSEYYDYIERVKASEEPLLNPTFGLAIGRRLGKKYTCNLGVGYTTLKKRIDYEFVDSLITIIDTALYDNRFYNSNNLFFLDVPITFGRFWKFGSSAIELSGGIASHIFLTSEGKTLSPESYDKVIDLSELEWRRVSFAFIGEVTYVNALTKNVDFLAKVFYKYGISNLYKVASKFEQRPNYIGVKVGFRYHF